MKKFQLFLLIILGGWMSATAQTANPYISLNTSPSTVVLGSTSTLSVVTGNFGNDNIVANSLRIVISAGSNASITGLGGGSDARWAVSSLGAGNANTIVLTNTTGTFTSFDLGTVNINIQGTVASAAQTITGNISYIAGINPLLNPPTGAQSSTQGNTVLGDDNSTTSLTVTSTPDFTPTIDINGLSFPSAGSSKDFVVNIIELQNSVSNGQVVFRVTKPGAFTVIPIITGTATIFGPVAIQNSDWTIDNSNPAFVLCTLKVGSTVPANGVSKVGFTITRNAGIGANTTQSITVVITNGSGGDINNFNNGANTSVTAN